MENVTPISENTGKTIAVNLDVLRDAIRDAYSRYFGNAPGKMSVEECASKINKSTQMIYDFRSGESIPRTLDLLVTAVILGEKGPDFLNMILAPVGLAGIHRVEGGALAILEVSHSLSQANTETMAAAADGIVDAREAASLATTYRQQARQLEEAADNLEDVAGSGGAIPVLPGKK